jgi:hypothetical protein
VAQNLVGESWFVTPTQMAEFLKITAAGAGEMDNVTECLAAALEWAQSIVGELTGAAVTYQVTANRDALVLPVTHLQEVLEVFDPSGNQVVPAAVDVLSGIVWVPNAMVLGRPQFTSTWQVRARAREHGESVALAVKIVASHLYTLHRGRATGFLPGVKPAGEDPAAPRGFAVPKRALELITPFRKPKGF